MKKTSFFLFLALLFSLGVTIYLQFFYPQQTIQKHQVELYKLDNIPVLKSKEFFLDDLVLSASAVYAIDLSSMTVLYEKDSQKVLYPASTSKMMTALVALDTFALEEELLVNQEATVSGNKLALQAGDLIKTQDLLAALLIFSANDSAYVLANNDPLGIDHFIEQMNQKAHDLGLTQTHFVNPAGLDDPGQVSTARDLSIIARELLKHQHLKDLVATQYKQISGANWSYDLYNSNQLLGQIQGVTGVKTGTTQLAGEVLVTLVERDGHQILITLMNSQDRYQDTSKLIAWILNNYEWKKLD